MKTTNYELSMKLKDAGVEQNGEFGHYEVMGQKYLETVIGTEVLNNTWVANHNYGQKFLCSAFTTDELLEMLPISLGLSQLTMLKHPAFPDKFSAGYVDGYQVEGKEFYSENLPDALAELLLWVRERKENK